MRPSRKVLQTLCILYMFANSRGFQLSVCTSSQPKRASLITVADSFRVLQKYQVDRVDVSIEDELKGMIGVNANIMGSRGFRTSSYGKGKCLKEACDKSCHSAVKYIKKKRKHKPRDHLPEQCYLVHDSR